MDRIQAMGQEMSAESPASVLEKITTPSVPDVSSDAPASVEPAEKPVDTTPETIITPPADEAPKLSEEQQSYINSLETPTAHGKEENKKVETEVENKNEGKNENVLDEDPALIKDLREVIKKNGNVKEFLKELATDINDLSPEQLMTRFLKQEYRGELTDQEITETIADTFGAESTLSKIEQKKKILEMRDKLTASQGEKTKKYLSDLPDNSAGIEQEKARMKEVNTKAISDLNAMKEKIIGKSILGMPVDDEKWGQIDHYIRNEASFGETFPILDSKGRVVGFDVEEATNYIAFKLFQKDIAKANIALGEIKGYNKMYEQRKRTSQENTQTGTVVTEQSLDEAMNGINFRSK